MYTYINTYIIIYSIRIYNKYISFYRDFQIKKLFTYKYNKKFSKYLKKFAIYAIKSTIDELIFDITCSRV